MGSQDADPQMYDLHHHRAGEHPAANAAADLSGADPSAEHGAAGPGGPRACTTGRASWVIHPCRHRVAA